MKALITKSFISTLLAYGTKEEHEHNKMFKNWVAENQGKFVEIDTSHVFDNQYNTVDGFRIYDNHIDKIIDDIREDKNIFFVAHANGKDEIKKVNFEDHLKNKRFYGCSDINGNYYRISRRSNIHFILVGKYIYITNGIGYTALNKARLTSNENSIVKYCADRILNNKF